MDLGQYTTPICSIFSVLLKRLIPYTLLVSIYIKRLQEKGRSIQ